ncbi:hypothetical protein ACFWIA_07735 [Streptomyces sp. NPDC127068]|uniref:hypothetical protein n=1 Tax=Streptomyces sp. NPDC127068 TaxID=3347127 RepID=UPI00364AADAE
MPSLSASDWPARSPSADEDRAPGAGEATRDGDGDDAPGGVVTTLLGEWLPDT